MTKKKSSHTHHNISWLQRALENIWYNNGRGKWLLLPLTFLYCAIHSFQRWKLTRKRSKPPLAIIIVGNISIGGTGKTPVVIHLARLLAKAGYKPGIITRGYGGKATQWPQDVNAESNAVDVGDEPVLMARHTHLPIAAGSDRCVDIQLLRSKYNCDVIISDDGLQHYPLHRDIEIVLIDSERQLGNGWCIPAGPLRENPQRLKSVDFVLLNNGSHKEIKSNPAFIQQHQLQSVFSMYLSGKSIYSLASQKEKQSLDDLQGKVVHAVTGIGNPQRFYQTLENAGIKLIKHSFPDHHRFIAEELVFNDKKIIIMTEKDAVKCQQFSLNNIWYLPIEARLEKGFDELLLDKLGTCMK